MKLLQKIATGQFVELGFRANEEMIRRSERRHHSRNGDHFDPTIRQQLFTAEFAATKSLADGTLDLAGALREKSAQRFFAGFDRTGEFRNFIESRCPEEGERIVATAQKILGGEFPVFNHGNVNIGDPPEWNLDPILNVRAPERFYGDIDFLNPTEAGDAKIVWEPSRLQFVYDLGQAYVLTGDERYARHFFDLLNHWNRRNRDYHGINFCSALEFAFRANSVIWGVFFFKDSPSLDQQAARDIYRLLYISGRFLANHLSRYFSPNTHLLGEGYGLYVIGMLFPEFAGAESWRTTGRSILTTEMSRQVLADGFHAELSVCYHAYSVEFALAALLLGERNFDKFEENDYARLRSMTDVLVRLRLPTGLWPHIGDDDGGRLMFLSRPSPFDYRPLLQAALMSQGKKIADGPSAPETFWLIGSKDEADLAEVKRDYAAVALRSSGVIITRSDSLHTVFQGGPFGYRDCPHSHADHLHLDLCVGGEHLIIDPGTLCYTADRVTRDLMRGSSSHNGPRLVGGEFYDANDPFGWLVKPSCKATNCFGTSYFSFFSAGYRLHLPDGTECDFRRQVLQVNDIGWMIQDRIECNRPQTVAWDFVTPGRLENCGAFIAAVGLKNHLRIRAHPRVAEGTMGERLISDDYGQAYVGNCLRSFCPVDQVLTLNHTIEAFAGTDLAPNDDERYSKFGRYRQIAGGHVAFVESKITEPVAGFETDAHFGSVFVHDNGDLIAGMCRVSKFVVGKAVLFESEEEVPFVEIALKDNSLKISAPAGAKVNPIRTIPCEIVNLNSLI